MQTGYREGITKGKLSTLQGGFDQGFNEVGAPLGRQIGLLRGQVAALLLLLSSNTSSRPTKRVKSSTTLPLLANPKVEEAEKMLRKIAAELDRLKLADVAEPDYEAMEHEREHEGAEGEVRRETEEEKEQRGRIVEGLKERLGVVREVLGLRPVALQ